jgi:hypothetical protein
MTIEGANYLQSGRFVYIGDYFYLVTQSGITTFALDTFDFINQLNF